MLALGGARSGKSQVAEAMAADLAAGGPVTVLATAVVRDEDMAARVAVHRRRRPAGWATVETGPRLAPALAEAEGVVLVEALGTWVADAPELAVDADGLCDTLVARVGHTVVVSEEVGLGVHPSSEVGRRFRDALGVVNQRVAAVADQVLLVVAGRILSLDPAPAWLERNDPAPGGPARGRSPR